MVLSLLAGAALAAATFANAGDFGYVGFEGLKVSGFEAPPALGAPIEEPPSGTGVDELLTRLQGTPDAREQLEILEALERWNRPLFVSEEWAAVRVLPWFAEGAFNDAIARGKSVRVLGHLASLFKNDAAQEDAVSRLAEFTKDSFQPESRRPLRLPALMSLARLAPALSSNRDRSHELLAGAALDALRRDERGPQRAWAMQALFQHIRARGTRTLEAPPLRGRLQSELIDPLRGGLDRLFDHRDPADARYRELLYGTLFRLARGMPTDERLRFDAREILRRADESRLEPEPRLRLLLGLYNGRGLPGLR